MALSTITKYLVACYLLFSFIYTSFFIFGLNKNFALKDTVASLKERYSSKKVVYWNNDSLGEAIGYTSEDLVISKFFSESMGPSKVVPYYFKASKDFDKEDITMATIVTHNRFKVLSQLATHYKGPVSVALHINDDQDREKVIQDLHELYKNNPDMGLYVDTHLIVDNVDRQFNMWRNVARFFTRTDFLMMLDVDFFLCTDFRKSLKAEPKLMDLLRSGKAAVVIPAFEYGKAAQGEDSKNFPTKKQDLVAEVKSKSLSMFHRYWIRGHGATNYEKWYGAKKPYVVTTYNYSYEPYVIYRKEGIPWCDERFVGYGANKAACLFDIYISGVDYWVLPNDFLIHQTHHYPEVTRSTERVYNRRLYEFYREEMCLHYARAMISANEWNTPKSKNLKKECTVIPGFDDIIKQVLDEQKSL